MRILRVAILALLAHRTTGFCPRQHVSNTRPVAITPLFSEEPSSDSKTNTSQLTSKDILARARKAAGLPVDDDEPDQSKLFEDEILIDMQESLLKLETRVKEGPGSLSMLEVEEFEAATKRILTEMKQKLAEEAAPAPAAMQAIPSPPPPSPQQQPASAVKSSHGVRLEADAPHFETIHKVEATANDEEGPAYDGKSGWGISRGTRNTYVIPGMDEMSPEEYRAALQKSVSDQQSERREGTGGVVGNRAALQYLDSLGWGGAASNWKQNEDEEQK